MFKRMMKHYSTRSQPQPQQSVAVKSPRPFLLTSFPSVKFKITKKQSYPFNYLVLLCQMQYGTFMITQLLGTCSCHVIPTIVRHIDTAKYKNI
jgi:hypothetical protein